VGEGIRVRQIGKVRLAMRAPRCRARHAAPATALGRDDCLEQLLEAFADIADRDDIHQAAERLARIQQWISREAEKAAADPIFAALRLAS
jgi:hypothetical protein